MNDCPVFVYTYIHDGLSVSAVFAPAIQGSWSCVKTTSISCLEQFVHLCVQETPSVIGASVCLDVCKGSLTAQLANRPLQQCSLCVCEEK